MLPSSVLWTVSRADICCGQLSIFSAVLHILSIYLTMNRNNIAISTSDAFVKCQVEHGNYLGMLHLLHTFDGAYLGDILQVWNFLNLVVCFWCQQLSFIIEDLHHQVVEFVGFVHINCPDKEEEEVLQCPCGLQSGLFARHPSVRVRQFRELWQIHIPFERRVGV